MNWYYRRRYSIENVKWPVHIWDPCYAWLGTIHKRRRHILAIFWTPPSPCRHFFTSNRRQNSSNFYPPPLKIADIFYGWPSIALDLMRPSFWGHLAMTINNIQTSRNWTRLTQSDQWCQQRQSNRVKRKNMDETHQSCLFTKYQKGQLVKKKKKESEGSWRSNA